MRVAIMTSVEDLHARRARERLRIHASISTERDAVKAGLKHGETAVAFVKEDLCIGCDQCLLVCDDDAIDMIHTPLRSPLLDVPSNRKAKIVREACTGCRLCVLACPTDAIVMLDR